MSKLTSKLSTTSFIVSQIAILAAGIALIAGLYFFINQIPLKPKHLSLNPVTEKPNTLTLELKSPGEDLLTYDSTILVSGKTAPLSNVLVSTETQDTVVESKKDGNFSLDFTLDLGLNEITITVFDKTGDSRSTARTVFYSKEKI